MKAPLPPWRLAATLLFAASLPACIEAPSPLVPTKHGSVGLPHRGVLVGGAELPRRGRGYEWLRGDDRHHGVARLIDVITRAAAYVDEQRPGALLAIGDLSTATGGTLLPHFSHRSGRDVDLLLYLQSLEGVPVKSPGFVHVMQDGLAWDAGSKRFLRLDVERQWLLVRFLAFDPVARTQWLFCNHNVKALLLEWATARGESGEALARADALLHEPKPGGEHDDHIHLRIACDARDREGGCIPWGPERDFHEREPNPTPTVDVDALARELGVPLARGAKR